MNKTRQLRCFKGELMAIAISKQNKEEADDHMFIVIYDFLNSKTNQRKRK